MVLRWREHISHSKFKDNIYSLNTDNVLNVKIILDEDREGECDESKFQSKIRCLFKHLLLVNWNTENMYSSYEDDIFPTQIKSEAETIWPF